MTIKKRYFISVYLQDGRSNRRKKGDVTLSFPTADDFYFKCKYLGSSRIKSTIGVTSYAELTRRAVEEERSIGNYIKYRLKMKLYE